MGSKQPRRLESGDLWNYALKALGGRAHSTGELREKLRRRAAKAEDVEPVLVRLKDYGYLDDRRYAENYAAARLSNDKLGSARVVRDLRQRRVAPGLAEKSVSQAYRDVKEDELIEDWVRRKYTWRPGKTCSRKTRTWPPRTAACCGPASAAATSCGC